MTEIAETGNPSKSLVGKSVKMAREEDDRITLRWRSGR
jgi:hypothetical protein